MCSGVGWGLGLYSLRMILLRLTLVTQSQENLPWVGCSVLEACMVATVLHCHLTFVYTHTHLLPSIYPSVLLVLSLFLLWYQTSHLRPFLPCFLSPFLPVSFFCVVLMTVSTIGLRNCKLVLEFRNEGSGTLATVLNLLENSKKGIITFSA